MIADELSVGNYAHEGGAVLPRTIAPRHRLTQAPRIDPHTLAEESRADHAPPDGRVLNYARGCGTRPGACPKCHPTLYRGRHRRAQVG